MKDIQVKVKVNSQIEGGELIAAVPISTKMNQDQTNTESKNMEAKTKEVAPIVFQPPPATEELIKDKEESGEPAPASKKLTSSTGGVAQDEKSSKKVNDDAEKIGSTGEVQAKKKQKVKEAPPKFNPGVGLGYDNNNMLTPFGGMSGFPPLAHHPAFNHHMYGSSSYPRKAFHRGVGGAHHMYYPQTLAADTAHRASMYGQAILKTVSTDSSTDAKKEMKDEIKDELAGIKKDVTMMKDMVSHLLIQNKELLIQNKELMGKIGN